MKELFIYVTTKGRYENCKTVDLIGNYKNLYIIVEPQEYEQYKNKYNDFNINANDLYIAITLHLFISDKHRKPKLPLKLCFHFYFSKYLFHF